LKTGHLPQNSINFLRLLLILPILLISQLSADPVLTADGLEGGNLKDWKLREDGVIEFTAQYDADSRVWRWFYFRIDDPGTETLNFEIPNASSAWARSSWLFTRPFISHDEGQSWQRAGENQYHKGVYTFSAKPESDSMLVALAPPYSYTQNQKLLTSFDNHPKIVKRELLTETLDGRLVDYLVVREPGDTILPVIWITARQHPAEAASSWKMESLLIWLLSEDEEAVELLKRVEFHIVPMMNPDGVVRGHYRYNAAGLDLNRQWKNEENSNAPTVKKVQNLMREQYKADRDIKCFVDLHAISSRQKIFMYYTEDLLMREEYEEEMQRFMKTFTQINPLFSDQKSEGIIPGETGIAKDWVHSEFLIPTYTFETTYQNVDYGPEQGTYLLVDDYKKLGMDLGKTLASIY